MGGSGWTAISPTGSVLRYQKVPLKMASLLQGQFTPGDDAFLVLGNRGTVLSRVDLKSFAINAIMEPAPGRAGFRADPAALPVLRSERGTRAGSASEQSEAEVGSAALAAAAFGGHSTAGSVVGEIDSRVNRVRWRSRRQAVSGITSNP